MVLSLKCVHFALPIFIWLSLQRWELSTTSTLGTKRGNSGADASDMREGLHMADLDGIKA